MAIIFSIRVQSTLLQSQALGDPRARGGNNGGKRESVEVKVRWIRVYVPIAWWEEGTTGGDKLEGANQTIQDEKCEWVTLVFRRCRRLGH
jgi:hypothetical protein